MKARAKLKPEGESIRLAPASSHPAVPAPLVRQRRRSLPGAGAAAPPAAGVVAVEGDDGDPVDRGGGGWEWRVRKW